MAAGIIEPEATVAAVAPGEERTHRRDSRRVHERRRYPRDRCRPTGRRLGAALPNGRRLSADRAAKAAGRGRTGRRRGDGGDGGVRCALERHRRRLGAIVAHARYVVAHAELIAAVRSPRGTAGRRPSRGVPRRGDPSQAGVPQESRAVLSAHTTLRALGWWATPKAAEAAEAAEAGRGGRDGRDGRGRLEAAAPDALTATALVGAGSGAPARVQAVAAAVAAASRSRVVSSKHNKLSRRLLFVLGRSAAVRSQCRRRRAGCRASSSVRF
jgi:hypothetical protein